MTEESRLEAWFVAERETKNTVRYQEATDGQPLIGYLYLQKSAVALLGAPRRLRVILEPLDPGTATT